MLAAYNAMPNLTNSINSNNYFEMFGIPISFSINKDNLTAAYLKKQGEIHPDVAGDVSSTQSAMLNVAYTALLDPVSRAEHFLLLRGISTQLTYSDRHSSEMFSIHEKYSSLSREEEKFAFRNFLKNRISEIEKSMYYLDGNIKEFADSFCLMSFIKAFLEKEGTDVYGWN